MARKLTDRQRQVATLFAVQGKSYRQVAHELGISPETINPHLKAAARNLGCDPHIGRADLRTALEAEALL